MSYPGVFNFLDKREAITYSHQPTGNLVVSRLLKNQPAWQKISLAQGLKQKSLLLTDWTLGHLKGEKLLAVQQVLMKLLKDGFNLYLWQDGEVKKLTQENLSCLDNQAIRNRVTPVFPEQAIEAAVKAHRLVHDQIHILDDYWVNLLLNPNQTDRQLSTSDVIASTHMASKIVDLVEQTKPGLKTIIHDQFSEFNAIFSSIYAQFPHTQPLIQYKQLVLDGMGIQTLLTEGKISYKGLILNIGELSDIEEFTLIDEDSISVENLQALLVRLSKLKKINLTNVTKLNSNFTKGVNFTSLETLQVGGSNITVDDFSYILQQALNLKSLIISGCKNLTPQFTNNLNFSQLENLETSASIAGEDIVAILKQAKALKSVKLERNKLFEGFSKGVNFENLESLDIVEDEQGDILNDDLLEILRQAKGLKKLCLTNHEALPLNFTKGLDFHELESLELPSTLIEFPDLRAILEQTSKLKKLILSNCELIPFFSIGLSFGQLDTLILNGEAFNIDNVDLNNILSQAITLKILYLNNCELCCGFTLVGNFHYLEELEVQNSNISVPDLETILRQARGLKRINLSYCQQLVNNFPLVEPLENLAVLDLSSLTITSAQLKNILSLAPNLKSLFILDCKGLVLDAELKKLLKDIVVIPSIAAYDIKPQTVNLQRVKKIDADTSFDPEKEHKLKKIFFPLDSKTPEPTINYYRQGVYHNVDVNPNVCLLEDAFTLSNKYTPEPLPTFIPCFQGQAELIDIGKKLLSSSNNETYYLGVQELVLSKEWQALNSLSSIDEITHYCIDPQDTKIEIAYSAYDNLYYVRGSEGKEVNLSFLLKTPSQSFAPTLPEHIKSIVNYFKEQFGQDELDLDESTLHTGKDYRNAIIDQKKGACRHRAVAFKSYMDEYNPSLPVRIVDNRCHAFVEIKIENQWVACDLGGYPVTLTIDDSNNPLEVKRQNKSSFSVMETEEDLEVAQYIEYLSTWKKAKPLAISVQAYCQQINYLNEEAKKRLIELESTDDVMALQLSLEYYYQHTSRPVFYVNSPDDLICSAPFIKSAKDNKGILTKGPGGPLYDFLQVYAKSQPPPVLIVNYDNFDADDIVRFNGLLDTVRHADGTSLPEEALVIGLINRNKPDCYQGSDFYSRFDTVDQCTLSSNQLASHVAEIASLPWVDANQYSMEDEKVIIDLYHTPDWKAHLLGRWELEGDNLYFVAGELEKALASGKPIELRNVPITADFNHFWRQAQLRGYINYEGRIFGIPANLEFRIREGYEWHSLLAKVVEDNQLISGAEVLNPGRLNEFLRQYHCQDSKLYSQPGILSRYANTDLHVNLTRELTHDEWALFLSACQEYKINLIVHRAPTILGPLSYLNEETASSKEELCETIIPLWQRNLDSKDMALVSRDSSTTLQSILKDNKPYLIIDISECESDDLLIHTRGEVDSEQQRFLFEQTKRALLNALDQGQQVILKGKFSDTLIDALAPLMLARQQDKTARGRLIVISDTPCFSYLDMQEHRITADEKRTLLAKHFSQDELKSIEGLYETESFNQLKARLNYLRHHPEVTTSQKNWHGLEGLSGGISLGEFNINNSFAIANAFNQKRLNEVNQVLSYSPYVFLAGLTGVGKSTFVEKNLNNNNDTLYQSEANILAWAKDKTPNKRKILFIDEANLSQRQFSEFEGLFYDPPTILIDGVVHTLTKDHKVVFAGNPLNYGDERHLASLFTEHGCAVVFEPLPQEFIYEYIIKPVFADYLPKNLVQDISQELLEVYSFLAECSTDEVLISPREVQMMALLVLSYLQQQKSLNPVIAVMATRNYAYQVVAGNVPERLKAEFDERFKPFAPIFQQDNLRLQEDFLITPSRVSIFNQINDLLALREYRQNSAINDAQRYGGLGGLILEGEPGIGKSELVILGLRSRGYEEVHFNRDLNKPLPEKPFYRMPVSLSLEEKKLLLDRAFNEGAVVVIDEINSSPMMERLLNDLLMGYNEKKERPLRPGFLVIGTQNPVTMAGRKAPSTALSRRLIKTELPPYGSEEMQDVLGNKRLDEKTAAKLVNAYEIVTTKAAEEHLTPKPTFRDLLRLGDNILKARKKHRYDTMEDDSLYDDAFDEPAEQRISKRSKVQIVDREFKKEVSLVDANNKNYQPNLFKLHEKQPFTNQANNADFDFK
ncbi:AAA family ATPase [Legionella sp. D16C41]|uniref:AAA family ATPase n=1 Tax=Legionella sp. D16C41 TaxID=3402688 RepID=UPI003AF6797D